MSDYFHVSRGVRQGCPLSPYLFIICTEVLNTMIKSNCYIKGVTINNTIFKISQYADDTVIISDGSECCLNEIYTTLLNFYNISGLKVNLDKSYIFPLGPYAKNHPRYFSAAHFPVSSDSITYLGISFTNHHEDFFRLNYLPKLSRVKQLLQSWATRDLTPIGKIHILKSFAISQIVYPLTVLPNPPDDFIKELNSIFFKFIWSNKPDKVKRTVLYNDKCNGGLCMIDLFTFAKSLKCKWVKLYLDNCDRPWKTLFDKSLSKYGGKFLFYCNFSKNDIHVGNTFISHICHAWADFNFRWPEAGTFGNQSILNNSYIKLNNKTIFIKSLKLNNAYLVKHFLNTDGNVFSYTDFVRKYNINHLPFTIYFGIVNAIPTSWKCAITNTHPPINVNDNTRRLNLFISALRGSQYIYKHIIQKRISQPVALSKWENSGINRTADWKTIFKLPYNAIRYTKIQYFQFRFLHRIIGVNSFLFKLNLIDSPTCSFCKTEIETLEHLFWTCSIVQSFWKDSQNLCIQFNDTIDVSKVFFGFTKNINHPINFYLLHAKYYIFNCKINKIKPDPLIFLSKLNFNLKIEKSILNKKTPICPLIIVKEHL